MPCLLPQYANEFLNRIKSGEILPEKLMDMTSAQRREYFGSFLGAENSQWVNAAFEGKLLLKHQQQGIVRWAQQISGLKPETRRDLLARVERMTAVLEPKDMNAFLEDLAAQKLGVAVNVSEAAQILTLAKDVSVKKTAMEAGPRRQTGQPATESELDYGRSLVAFNNYVNDLKEEAGKTPVLEQAKEPLKLITKAAGITKSIKASMDVSAIFRQGWRAMWTHPKIWAQASVKSFRDVIDTWGGKAVQDELLADIVSRPNYNRMLKAKLDVGKLEEAFPTPLPGKMPVVGLAYQASENAFTNFQRKTRADIFDAYMEIAEESGVDINDKTQLEAIGKLVNALTGRGHLGKGELIAEEVNNIFFSPRFLKSHYDFLTGHLTQKEQTPFVRKQAAKNLVKVISGTASVLAIAKAIGAAFGEDDIVELDPRSANFGTIRIKDTRFDVTGGMKSLFVLASRLATMKTKSSITGKMSSLNTGEFRGRTRMDVIYDFFEGKLSPTASVLTDILRGEDFRGERLDLMKEAGNLLVPLSIANTYELAKNPNSAPIVWATLAEALGVGTQTYSAINWYDPKDELRIGNEYGILPRENEKFIPIMDDVSKRGISMFDPKIVSFGDKPLEGNKLREYKTLRFIIFKDKMLGNEARLRGILDKPKELDFIVNSIKQETTTEAKTRFRQKYKMGE